MTCTSSYEHGVAGGQGITTKKNPLYVWSLVNPYRIVNKPAFLTGQVRTHGTCRDRRLPVTGCRHDPDAVESLPKIMHAPCPSGEVLGVEGGLLFFLFVLVWNPTLAPLRRWNRFWAAKPGDGVPNARGCLAVYTYIGTGDLGLGNVDGIYLTR